MNTKQFIVLWYAGLTGAAAILAYWTHIAEPSVLWPFACIVIIAGLLIFTLGNHPNANKRAVLVAVAVPPLVVVGLGTLGAIYLWRQQQPAALATIPIAQVNIFDATIRFNDMYGGRSRTGTIAARVTNRSQRILHYLSLRVNILDKNTGSTVDGSAVEVRLAPDGVLPGETPEFRGNNRDNDPARVVDVGLYG